MQLTHAHIFCVEREIEAMEIGKGGVTTMAKKKAKLAIENYLDFIDERTVEPTVNQLRQIIAMHGYKKIEAPKRILIDMVKTMDLMDLSRSTLLDGAVSGDAGLTLEEVINDLKNLEWQECHVTSLLTQGAAVSASSATGDEIVSVKQKRSKGLRSKRVAAIDQSVISTTGTTVAAGSTTETRRKRSKGLRRMPAAAVDHSVISTVGTTAAARSTTEGKRKRQKGLWLAALDQSDVSINGTAIAAGSTTERSVDCNCSEL